VRRRLQFGTDKLGHHDMPAEGGRFPDRVCGDWGLLSERVGVGSRAMPAARRERRV